MDGYLKDPLTIERESFRIIRDLLPPTGLPPAEESVLFRLVHTSGDPAIVGKFRFTPGAVEEGIRAIRAGKSLYVDTRMAFAGLDKKRLGSFGCLIQCGLDFPDLAEAARRAGITRSMAAVDLIGPWIDGGVAAIGNAPTALFRLVERIRRREIRPALVIAMPVGFVGAAESKEELGGIPHITVSGTRGGSPLAAAAVNALARLAQRREEVGP